MFSALLDVLFPKRCVACSAFGTFLCADCFSKIQQLESGVCPQCLRPAVCGITHAGCKTSVSLAGLLSSYNYYGVVKRLLHKFKYSPYLSSLETILGELFQESLLQNELFFSLIAKNPIIIPVPLHRKRYLKRGYNHAALLATHVAQYFKIEILEHGLVRVKETKPQFKLDRVSRLKNIHSAFEVNEKIKEKIKGRQVLLIDDLSTTCTTLREAAKVLKRAGAQEVWGLTFAKEV